LIGYNLSEGGRGTGGLTPTMETRQKMSKSHTGVIFTAEHIKNLKLHRNLPEIKEQTSIACKNFYVDPIIRKNFSELMLKYFEDHSEISSKMSDRTLKYYKDHPEAREQQSCRMKQLWFDHPEIRKQAGLSLTQFYINNPAARELASIKNKKYYDEHPEVKKQISLRMTGKKRGPYKKKVA
jgi:hypothetical protein